LSPEPEYQEPQVQRPAALERSRARRRSGQSFDGSPGRSRYGNGSVGSIGSGSQRMEEVLEFIQKNLDFMTNDTCVPIQISLKLLDSSSLGLARQYDQFESTYQQLQSALRAIVNEHHQGFNSSIGTFHKIQASISSSQHRVRELKDSLVQAKSDLATTKPELRGFATSSQNYDDMLQVLGMIEQLQLVPEKLEARISEKRFLTAVDVLHEALGLIRRSEMENIGALSDLRVYLSNQEHSLTDILIEELHSHLYLKSPYCEDRWKAFNPIRNVNDSNMGASNTRGRSLYQFLETLDVAHALKDDSSRSPEADTFGYIRLVVEALSKMDRLEVAMDTIEQRLPVELFRVVEKSNNEVDHRHPSALRGHAKSGHDNINMINASEDARSILLNDLLWTLYSRFEAIAESHRVVYEVVNGIVKREKLRDGATLVRTFKELWKLYQSEMRSLLHDYLATDGDMSYRSGQGASGPSSVFRTQRDRNKKMFKLTDIDNKASELTQERDDLEFILKSSVPGLVSDSKRLEGALQTTSQHHDGSATGHKLLVEPSVFNMGILLPPSLEFLNRLKEVVPPGSDIAVSTLTSFLDDFLVNVFHPQLDETLVELCTQTFIEIDAFQQDPQWGLQAQKPIFKGTTKFYQLITAFCRMLDNLPHDQALSQLLISQMVTYYDKCYGWYKALMTRAQAKADTGSRTKAAASFAEDEELGKTLDILIQADETTHQAGIETESSILIAKTNESPLDIADITSDRKTIASLCMLYTSMKWLASKVAQLRVISDRAIDSSRRDSGRFKHKRRWTLVNESERRDGDGVYLPLNQETATAFDGVVSAYQSLATTVLRNIHLEIRCRVLYHLYQSFNGGFFLEQPFNDPDEEVVALNTSLVDFDEEISTHLQHKQHE
jgi:exocyst complex component 4